MQTTSRRTHGTGGLSVRTDAAGRESYYGHWHSNGQRVKRKLGPKRTAHCADGLTRVEAEARLREVIAEVQVAAPVDRRMTVAEAAQLHVAAMHRRGMKPSSIRTTEVVLERWVLPRLGSEPLERVTPQDVDELRDAMQAHGLQPKTIRNYVLTLGAVYRHVLDPRQRLNVATTNPVAAVELPKVPDYTGIRFISKDEVWCLADAAQPGAFQTHDRAFYLTAALAGLRFGELLALQWQDVDLMNSKLRVRWSWDRKSGTRTTPKSRRSQRTVPLNPELAGELERLGKSSLGENFDPDRHADALVFADPQTGLPMIEHQVRRRYKLARAQAGLRGDLRIHDLRHTFATLAAGAGVPMTTLKEWLGHRDLATTQRYADYAPSLPHELAMLTTAFARSETGTLNGTLEPKNPVSIE